MRRGRKEGTEPLGPSWTIFKPLYKGFCYHRRLDDHEGIDRAPLDQEAGSGAFSPLLYGRKPILRVTVRILQ